jgi:hypothetical protein
MVINRYFDIFRHAYAGQNACQGKMTSGRCKNQKIGGENRGFGSVQLIVKTLEFTHFIAVQIIPVILQIFNSSHPLQANMKRIAKLLS